MDKDQYEYDVLDQIDKLNATRLTLTKKVSKFRVFSAYIHCSRSNVIKLLKECRVEFESHLTAWKNLATTLSKAPSGLPYGSYPMADGSRLARKTKDGRILKLTRGEPY